ncbi:hypothetical protein ACWGCI_17265 [Streptomyces sp. NPDC054949]|uniref:hypothetical protein n=1 Tax=Streptomyces sp. NBC_00424 TaxID=2903648 RepID=UPI00224CAAD4|nr:hypothetical protein [Streptomyces sp. NBC_00424]MCX5077911.1 hypothetical protein [Streptomyces sp. NBC_00424]
MSFVRTTPPRPVDVAAVFPELAPLARSAIRLHPRAGLPSAFESSVGGPLLWPADEPWPHCDGSHQGGGMPVGVAEVRLEHRRQARLDRDPHGPEYTPEETAVKERNDAVWMEVADAEIAGTDPPWTGESPVPMLPVAQLYLRDIPLLRPPGQADLLQVLWCPHDHDPDNKPVTALFWRSAAAIVDILATPPEPLQADWEGYVPKPCLLAPEQVTEYPNSLDLSPQMRQMVGDWSRWQAADVGVDSSYADYPEDFYDGWLADSPGWKVGGWPPWGRTDPYRRFCAVCDAQMVPLLTIASFEWDGGTPGWAPYEDQTAAFAAGHVAGQNPAQPTAVEVGSTDNMQLYVCPSSPEHPHTDLIQ